MVFSHVSRENFAEAMESTVEAQKTVVEAKQTFGEKEISAEMAGGPSAVLGRSPC